MALTVPPWKRSSGQDTLWEEREPTNPDLIKCGLTGSGPCSSRGQSRAEWSSFSEEKTEPAKPEPFIFSHPFGWTPEKQTCSALVSPCHAVTLLAHFDLTPYFLLGHVITNAQQ